MKLYICGRITGNPWYEDEFKAAAGALEKCGYEVLNPASLSMSPEPDRWLNAMREAIRMLTYADGVAIVDGTWVRSKGAKAEVSLARDIGLPVSFVHTWVAQSGAGE